MQNNSLTKLVHLDLKGGALKLDYLKSLIQCLKPFGLNGLLIEYEDMFPYGGSLRDIAGPDAYNVNELKDFLIFCQVQQIQVIPLVQTYGHFEFVLKHESFRQLRENYKFPMTLCPSIVDSLNLLKEMMKQIIDVHSDITHIHIGGDEIFDFNLCGQCKTKELDRDHMFLDHMSNVASFVKKDFNLQPIMWDDMLRDIPITTISATNLPKDVELMIWNYSPEIRLTDEYLLRIRSIFSRLWAASAFKGANGPVQQIVNTSVYVKNQQSWLTKIQLINNTGGTQGGGQFIGIALTGWSRFDHFASLCELLPCAVPCLAMCLEIIKRGAFTVELHESVSKLLGFPELIPWEPLVKCVDPRVKLEFPGYEIYQAVMGWFTLNYEVTQALNSEMMNGWLSKYHRHNLRGNAATVDAIANQLIDMSTRFNDWKQIFEEKFRAVFVDSCVNEWMQQNVDFPMDKLMKRIRAARQVVALGDCVYQDAVVSSGELGPQALNGCTGASISSEVPSKSEFVLRESKPMDHSGDMEAMGDN